MSGRCAGSRHRPDACGFPEIRSELGLDFADLVPALLDLGVRRVLADAAQRPAGGFRAAAGDAGAIRVSTVAGPQARAW